MKIGLIVRKDYGGLAYQTHALHKLLGPYKTLVIDSTPFNGFKQHTDWYKDAEYTSIGFPNDDIISSFVEGLDCVISCEVPYNDNLYAIARSRGVKTILQPNAELNPHFVNHRLDKPDAFVLPSTWYDAETNKLGVPTYLAPPPIDLIPEPIFKHKEQGKLSVLHVKGKKAAYDRNGTEIVERINIPGIDIHVHDQLQNPVENQAEIYNSGYDLMLLPRRYGGLCLPMYESLGYGLPVIMTNVSPNSHLLPSKWLVDFSRSRPVRTKRTVFAYEANFNRLQSRLIHFRDMNNEDYQVEKYQARKIFEEYEHNLNNWFTIIEEIVGKK